MKADPLLPPLKSQPKLGIIAGGGNLPKQAIAACHKSGRPFFVLAIEGQTDPDSVRNVSHAWVKTGAIGQALKVLKQNDVKDLVMAGYYKRPAWKELRPDFVGAKWLAKFIAKIGKDDSILRLVIQEFEDNGFHVKGVEEIIGPEIMVSEGPLGQHKPSAEDWVSIHRGFEVLKVLGKVDVGQSIIVQEGAVVGIEGIEGTDKLMTRCKDLHPAGQGGILVKIAKPDQDRRVDMPVIGERTLRNAIESGIKGIAVEAGSVIILDQEKVTRMADKASIFIIGVREK